MLLFNSIHRRNGEGFNGFIKLVEIYPHTGNGGDAVIEAGSKQLCDEYGIRRLTSEEIAKLRRGIKYFNQCSLCFKVTSDLSSISHTEFNIDNYHNIGPKAGKLASLKLTRNKDYGYATYETQHDWIGYYSSMVNASYIINYETRDISHAFFIVYYISGYRETTEVEDNYLFWASDFDNIISVCFLNDKKTIRIKGTYDDEKKFIDVNKFPDSKQNPCETGKWNVLCAVYNAAGTGVKSSLWVNEGKAAEFQCCDPLPSMGTITFFSDGSVDSFGTSPYKTFNGQIANIEVYSKPDEEGDPDFKDSEIMDKISYLCSHYNVPRNAPVY